VMGGVASDGYGTDDTDELMARAAGADLLGPWVPRRRLPRDPASGAPEPTVTALTSQAVAGGAADWMFAFSRRDEGPGDTPAGEAVVRPPPSLQAGPLPVAVHPMLSKGGAGATHPMMMAVSVAAAQAPAPAPEAPQPASPRRAASEEQHVWGSSGFRFVNRLPDIQPDFQLTYM
jgi:hypothetical protein